MTGTLALVRPRRDCACPRARHQHGTVRAYIADRCRCQDCATAHTAYEANRRRQIAYGRWDCWASPVGTVRRLRALARVGWTFTAVAASSGDDPSWLRRIAAGRTGERMHRDVAAHIATVYDELWAVTPVGAIADRTRRTAAARGWALPLSWDDDELDDPNAVPHTPVGCSSWDLQPCGTDAAARRHHRAGEPLDEACRRASNRIATERRARRAAQVRADLDALTA